eukprot:5417976-Alexandrium_andersonii.AAC.1
MWGVPSHGVCAETPHIGRAPRPMEPRRKRQRWNGAAREASSGRSARPLLQPRVECGRPRRAHDKGQRQRVDTPPWGPRPPILGG